MRWLRQQLVSTTSCMRQGYRFTCHIECSPSDSEHRSGWEGPRSDNQSFYLNPTRCSSRRRTGLSTAPFCSSTGTVVSGVSMSVRGSGGWPVSTSRASPNSTTTMCSIPTVNTSICLRSTGTSIEATLMADLSIGSLRKTAIGTFSTESLRTDHALPMSKLANLPIPESSHCCAPLVHRGVVDTGEGHVDGPEWAPVFYMVYFNTESFTDEPG